MKKKEDNSIGNLIKKARELKSHKYNITYTQNLLAKDIGKSQGHIGDIEKGRCNPSIKTLTAIAKACECPMSFFYDSSELDNKLEAFVTSQLGSTSEKDLKEIIEAIKNYKNINVLDLLAEKKKIATTSKTPVEAIKHLLTEPIIEDYCNLDLSSLDEEDILNLSEDILNQIKLISYKYKK